MESNKNTSRTADNTQSQHRDHRDGSEETSQIGAIDRDVLGNNIQYN